MSRGAPCQAVLLDAYGTLLELDEPVERLRRGLREDGHDHGPEVVAQAFRTEVEFYRASQDRGRDRAGLEALRRDCAEVLAAALPSAPPAERMARILGDALRYRLFGDVVPALDALAGAGLRMCVVSNWDRSLLDVLSGLGILDRFAVVSVSAVVGARKPDAAIFRHALAALGVRPGQAIHAGNSPELDCLGAVAAGLRGVLVDRDGAHRHGPCDRVDTLAELVPLVSRLGNS